MAHLALEYGIYDILGRQMSLTLARSHHTYALLVHSHRYDGPDTIQLMARN
jgi:hypothetical protein